MSKVKDSKARPIYTELLELRQFHKDLYEWAVTNMLSASARKDHYNGLSDAEWNFSFGEQSAFEELVNRIKESGYDT
jgi:hypothetical protein